MRSMRRMGLLSVALAAAIAAGCTNSPKDTTATGTVGTSGTAADSVSTSDKAFVRDAAIGGMAEVELGRLATERAANAEVKKFGQMMIDDHTAAGDRLKTVASERRIEIPAELDSKHRDLRDKLAQKQGAEFDQEYISAMVDGHQDFVDKLESRIDKKTLSEWKAGMADRTTGTTAEARGKEIIVQPETSDDPTTMKLNQWASEVYPTVYAHLESAKAIDKNLKKRQTTP